MGLNAKKLPTFLFRDNVKSLLVTSKYVLSIISLWPENQNWFDKSMHCFFLFSYAYFLYGNIYVISTTNDISVIAMTLTVFGVTFQAVIRRVLIYVYRHRLTKLLNDMYFLFWPSTYAGEKLNKQLGKEAKYLMTFCIVYSTGALLGTFLYIIVPMSKMSTPFLTVYPFNWLKNPYYSLLYTWQAFCFFETFSAVSGWNLFFVCLCYNCVSQFKLLKTHIRKNLQKHKYDIGRQKKFVIDCVVQHYIILQVCEELNQICYYFSLFLFLISIKTCCLGAFIMTTVPDLFSAACCYIYGHIIQLFLYCYLGNELALQSVELADAVYMCEWELYVTDKKLRKSLALIMMRAQKPVKISAGGFGFLQMSSFVKILRFSFSVYTVLKTLVQKEEA